MDYCLLPQNLTPNASNCILSILCNEPLQSVRWCVAEEYPMGLIATSNSSIQVTKNGVYFVELTTATDTVLTQFSICHLKSCGNFAGGDGSPASPFLIENCAQFNRIRRNLNAHYRLIADLHFEDEMKNICWLPIGKFSMKQPKIDPNTPLEDQDLGYQIKYGFTGELDGNGHTISGLTCNLPKRTDASIFASCGSAYIHHLKIENCSFGSPETVCSATLTSRAENTLIEWCIAKNIFLYPSLSGGLVYEAYPGTIIRKCQFEGSLYSPMPCIAYVGGIVGDAYEHGTISGGPVQVEDCCVNADISSSTLAGGILRGDAVVSRCLFRGRICSSDRAGGIHVRGEECIIKNCVCAAAEILCEQNVSIAQPYHREQKVFDDYGILVGTNIIDTGWNNVAGRIRVDDFTLEPQEEFINYGVTSCKVRTGTGEHPAREGSLRDGVTISDEQARDPDFYRSIGWDFDTVWEMGEDGYPQIISP